MIAIANLPMEWMVTLLRALVLEKQDFERCVLVRMLNSLGVRHVLQARNEQHAIAQMQLFGGVDIVLCDLRDQSLDCLDFLARVHKSGLVRSVVLCGELQPELQRTLCQMSALAGMQLLGVLNYPIRLRALHRVVRGFSFTPMEPPAPLHPRKLPDERDVRDGLALGEFRAWFQPQIDLRSGDVLAVEALVRWEHPSRGVLLPCDFLAAVVAYDLIDQMFLQLLEQGLSLLHTLRARGMGLTLSFNLHASQLAGDGLIEDIKRVLEQHAFRGSTLVFELSENGLLDSPPQTLENLLRLRLLGCGLAIDDFAMGFSSLRRLCQLPFNQIKLDGRSIPSLDCPAGRAMVEGIQALARSLGMSLVIEGVSNSLMRDRLLQLGCETGQGFFLKQPMNIHALLQWLDGTAEGA